MSLVTENLGVLIVIAAVLLGGLVLRAMDRHEARPSARPRLGRSRGSGPRHFRAPACLEEWVAMGQRARYDDATIRRVRETLADDLDEERIFDQPAERDVTVDTDWQAI